MRAPFLMQWPGKLPAGTVVDTVISQLDILPTSVVAGGGTIDPTWALDGVDLLPFLTGKAKTGPRKEIFYFSDDGDLTALRYNDWKLIFMEQKTEGTFRVWMEPFVPLRVPLILNLRRDPYERAEITSNTYFDWVLDRVYLMVPAQTYVGDFLATFKDYPPRQKAASFSLDQVMKMLEDGGSH